MIPNPMTNPLITAYLSALAAYAKAWENAGDNYAGYGGLKTARSNVALTAKTARISDARQSSDVAAARKA